jgi:hypothetical protein
MFLYYIIWYKIKELIAVSGNTNKREKSLRLEKME